MGLPPSALFVRYVLRQAGEPMLIEELAAETDMHDRTLRYGIKQLDDAGEITRRRYPMNARKTLVELDAE